MAAARLKYGKIKTTAGHIRPGRILEDPDPTTVLVQATENSGVKANAVLQQFHPRHSRATPCTNSPSAFPEQHTGNTSVVKDEGKRSQTGIIKVQLPDSTTHLPGLETGAPEGVFKVQHKQLSWPKLTQCPCSSC